MKVWVTVMIITGLLLLVSGGIMSQYKGYNQQVMHEQGAKDD